MSRIMEPTPEQEAGWRAWVASRPPAVRAAAERFDPLSVYRLKTSGQRVTLFSFSEAPDGTVTLTVNVTGAYNAVICDRGVFGIHPDDLEPCELPGPEEPVGTLLSPTEVEQNIDTLRVMVRPDLWVMGDDGKAIYEPVNPEKDS